MTGHEIGDGTQVHSTNGCGAETSFSTEPFRETQTPEAEPASYRERGGLSRRALFATRVAMTTLELIAFASERCPG